MTPKMGATLNGTNLTWPAHLRATRAIEEMVIIPSRGAGGGADLVGSAGVWHHLTTVPRPGLLGQAEERAAYSSVLVRTSRPTAAYLSRTRSM